MPNHITNRLTIKAEPEKVQEIFEKIKIEESEDAEVFGYGTIDFNKIIPMPADLMNVEANSDLFPFEIKSTAGEPFRSVMNRLHEGCNSDKKFDEIRLKNFLKGCENYIRYGAASWYGWSIENWGTKWNAYGQPSKLNTDNALYFQTAWDCPFPVIAALSEMYPDVEIEIAWADEDVGYNVGIRTFKNGKKISEKIPKGGSREAYAMYFEITQETPEEHGMNENYEYIEV